MTVRITPLLDRLDSQQMDRRLDGRRRELPFVPFVPAKPTGRWGESDTDLSDEPSELQREILGEFDHFSTQSDALFDAYEVIRSKRRAEQIEGRRFTSKPRRVRIPPTALEVAEARERAQAKVREWRELMMLAGRCIGCGSPLDTKHKRCADCLGKACAHTRGWRKRQTGRYWRASSEKQSAKRRRNRADGKCGCGAPPRVGTASCDTCWRRNLARPPQPKEAKRACEKKRRERLKNEQRCHRCKAPTAGALYCPKCSEKARLYQKERRAEQRRSQLCTRCPRAAAKPARPGKETCEDCAKDPRHKLRRRALVAAGICFKCGKQPAAAPAKSCDGCLAKRRTPNSRINALAAEVSRLRDELAKTPGAAGAQQRLAA